MEGGFESTCTWISWFLNKVLLNLIIIESRCKTFTICTVVKPTLNSIRATSNISPSGTPYKRIYLLPIPIHPIRSPPPKIGSSRLCHGHSSLCLLVPAEPVSGTPLPSYTGVVLCWPCFYSGCNVSNLFPNSFCNLNPISMSSIVYVANPLPHTDAVSTINSYLPLY